AASGYDALLHGEAVSMGMMCAARLAHRIGRVDGPFVERQRALIEALGLPLVAPEFDHDELLDLMYRDKKVDDGKLRFVLPDRIGHVELVKDVRTDDVVAALNA
ncbi:MAG: 3-dehydroquinate synthase, partial [Planctomycetes bacterium]|nr:3-dehydroquinate synthase [Planctomycetota bacterium]